MAYPAYYLSFWLCYDFVKKIWTPIILEVQKTVYTLVKLKDPLVEDRKYYKRNKLPTDKIKIINKDRHKVRKTVTLLRIIDFQQLIKRQ